MILFRSSWSTACIAIGLGGQLVCAPAASAQTFVEFGGGWNYLAPASTGNNYVRGFNIRASVGRQFAPNLRWRIDAFRSEFDNTVQYVPPCPPPGCTHLYYEKQSVSVTGLTANGLVNVDPRGIFYVIGGAGLYVADASSSELHLGVAAGAGIAVPLGARLRAVVEGRWHGLLGATDGPPWLVPITVGLRF